MQNTYKLCLGIQDASNFSGVLNAFSESTREMRSEIEFLRGAGVELNLRDHPAALWFMCKLSDLNGMFYADHASERMSLAYTYLTAMSGTTIGTDDHVDLIRDYTGHLVKLRDKLQAEIAGWAKKAEADAEADREREMAIAAKIDAIRAEKSEGM